MNRILKNCGVNFERRAIVKHIVAVHRAGLTLVSEPGEGTTITVTF